MIESIICARTENGVIGNNGGLPWKRLSDDMKHFKKTTIGHTVIMGRKTFESFGAKLLPNRTNIILSRNKNLVIEGAWVMEYLEVAYDFARLRGEEECFIIGGENIFRETICIVNRVYLTSVQANLPGDCYFNYVFRDEEWTKTDKGNFPQDEKNDYPYSISIYNRKRSV